MLDGHGHTSSSRRTARTPVVLSLCLLARSSSMRTAAAFQTPYLAHSIVKTTSTRAPSSSLNVGGMGWDNENFLESLGKGPDAINEANAEYDRIKRNVAGGPPADYDPAPLPTPSSGTSSDPDALPEEGVPDAKLTADQIERIKNQNEEETAGGGEMFKKLMERAQQGGGKRPPPEYSAPQQPAAQQQQPPPPPPAQPAASTTPSTEGGAPALPAGFENLSVEAQAALFRELMKNPDGAPGTPGGGASAPPQQWPEAPGPRPPATGQAALGADGRRIGRNRDADAIVNSADVYFAQLKRDSQIRNRARYSGETDKAEQVFADPSLQEIKLHTNPFMEEQRKKEQAMLDTSPEEYINPDFFAEPVPVDLSDTGISYKEKLKLMREKKKQGGSGGAAAGATTTESFYSAPPAASEPFQKEELNVEAAAAPPPKVEEPAAEAVVPLPPIAEPVQAAPPQPPVAPAQPATTTTTTATSSTTNKEPEEMRRDIRTLMGLLLKHRGGPGFGAGRIQGAEIQKFDQLADEIVATLRAEAAAGVSSSSSSTFATAQQQQVPTMTEAQPGAASVGVGGGISLSKAPVSERVDSMIACIEGAILMYKNSPPELQGGVLVTLRAALLSAATTCNEVLGPSEQDVLGSTQAVSGGSAPAERIQSMISVIEGAILMYKNSPPELRGSVLLTLRAALLSAVHTCNDIVGNNSSFGGGIPTSETTTVSPPPPSQFMDVEHEVAAAPATPPPEPIVAQQQAAPTMPEPPAEVQQRSSAPEVYSGNDENTQWLEKVYDKLKNAAGDGKMGLRMDLSAEDAEDLANDISQMRMMLVEELESGIPEEESSESNADSSASSSTTSKYQEMLAKARAEKEGKSFE